MAKRPDLDDGEDPPEPVHEDCASHPELAAACPKCRHTVPDPPETSKQSRIKNTRRWCRGKVGVEHVLEWLPYDTVKNHVPGHPGLFARRRLWRIQICTVCRKELAHDYPWN
jgi:hypothetical protein